MKQWIHRGVVRTSTTTGGHHRIAEAEIERLLARSSRVRNRAKRAKTPRAWIVALSGRNRLHGFVEEVRVDGLMAQVRLRIGDQILTAVITHDAVDELKLRRGDDAVAIVKATEVMIAREIAPPVV